MTGGGLIGDGIVNEKNYVGKKKLKRKITHNLLIKLFNNYFNIFLISRLYWLSGKVE